MRNVSFSAVIETLFFPALAYLAILNALLPEVVRSLITMPLNAAVFNGLGHSFIVWIVLFLSIRLTLQVRQKPIQPPSTHLVIGIFLALVLMIPSAIVSWVVAAAAAWLWLQNPLNESHRIAATILFAMAIREPTCQLCLTLFANQILSFDAWFSSLFLPLFQIEAAVAGNTIVQANGYSLLVLTGCSAFTNMSLALLLWLSLSLLRHGALQTKDIFHAIVLACLVLIINGLRLSTMAINEQWYDLLHGEIGTTAIEVFTFIVTFICIRRRVRHENANRSNRYTRAFRLLIVKFKKCKNLTFKL